MTSQEQAQSLFEKAVSVGLVSEQTDAEGLPKRVWLVQDGQAYEAKAGGSKQGSYHGFPIMRTDPAYPEIIDAWERLACHD